MKKYLFIILLVGVCFGKEKINLEGIVVDDKDNPSMTTKIKFDGLAVGKDAISIETYTDEGKFYFDNIDLDMLLITLVFYNSNDDVMRLFKIELTPGSFSQSEFFNKSTGNFYVKVNTGISAHGQFEKNIYPDKAEYLINANGELIIL